MNCIHTFSECTWSNTSKETKGGITKTTRLHSTSWCVKYFIAYLSYAILRVYRFRTSVPPCPHPTNTHCKKVKTIIRPIKLKYF